MQEENNVFTAKTVDEAIDEGLKALGITLADAEIEILEEGKKRLIGSVKARVRVTKQGSKEDGEKKKTKEKAKEKPAKKSADSVNGTEDAKRATQFVNGLLNVLGFNATAETVSEEGSIVININTTESAKVIGKHGDVLDAIQTMAGAVANIGRDEYKKVVVDCEKYRAQREETLVALANKVAKKAIETGRKVILEPMSAYERRIIHATLSENAEVKTVSEGDEPVRHIAVIPNGAKPYDRGIRFGNNRDDRRGDRNRRGRDDRRGGRRGGGERRPQSSGGAKRGGKREIHFGTFLGNSKDLTTEEKEKTEE